MKKLILKILFFIIAAAIGFNVFQFVKPFLRSDEKIEYDILKLMPIGTSWEEVVEIIESNEKWYVPTSKGLVPWASVSEFNIQSIAEKKGINLSLRDYGHPLYYAFFAVNVKLRFDENFKLIEVEVRQYLSI